MKGTYCCNDCETTIEINAKELPESVSCPNCNAAMEELETTLEERHLSNLEADTQVAVLGVLRKGYDDGVKNLGTTVKARRAVIRAVKRAAGRVLGDWARVALKDMHALAEASNIKPEDEGGAE